MTDTPSRRRPSAPSRRRFLALAGAGISVLSGCGYRPGGGDHRWEIETGTGPYRPDDVLATGGTRRSPASGTLFTVNRSRRGYDFEAEEWGESAEIAAYDAPSGAERWEETTTPSGRPAAHGGTLYLGHEDGGLTALDADGGTHWEASVGDFPRTLVASGDRVYALTDAGDLAAVSAAEGERLWRTSVGSGNGTALTATADGVVVHHSEAAATTTVAAIRRDGEERWTAELSGDLGGGRPVVTDEAVFVPADRSLVALSRKDGSERWSRETGRHRGPPAAADGAVYHVAGRTLYARDAGDGEMQWQSEPSNQGEFSVPPAVADGTVYAAGGESIRALSGADGSVRWRVETGHVTARPLVVGRTVVVATSDGVVRGHRRE